ncbi:MAG: hypothetical protein M1818_007688 [Claussenomyces sp. TS43310]|nr:MAG: hypothetical protein M1818_007688 [Claussenomyces sp. TS43310]
MGSRDDLDGWHVGFKERMHHFTWTWFTLTMSTGGLALLLSATPHRFNGLNTIGTVFFILNLVFFVILVAGISARFYMFPGTFTRSIYHPTESLLFPTPFLTIAVIIGGIQKYGVPHSGPWLLQTERVLFWIYCAISFAVAISQYYILFTGRNHTVQNMTPSWILPVFPVMLAGTIGGMIAGSQPAEKAMPIIVAGVTFQGLGMMVSSLMYSLYLGRLMSDGLPEPDLRPGMFIAVGPPAFTGLALIGLSKAVPANYSYFETFPAARETVQTIATFTAVFLWSLSFWLFAISLMSCLFAIRAMKFHLTWWSFVFPNVGFTIATIDIGEQLQSEGILWLGSAMTCILVGMWFFVIICHIKAVLNKEIMWPGKDEDAEK